MHSKTSHEIILLFNKLLAGLKIVWKDELEKCIQLWVVDFFKDFMRKVICNQRAKTVLWQNMAVTLQLQFHVIT